MPPYTTAPSAAKRDKALREANPELDQATTSAVIRRLQRKAWRRERRERLGYGYTTDHYGLED